MCYGVVCACQNQQLWFSKVFESIKTVTVCFTTHGMCVYVCYIAERWSADVPAVRSGDWRRSLRAVPSALPARRAAAAATSASHRHRPGDGAASSRASTSDDARGGCCGGGRRAPACRRSSQVQQPLSPRRQSPRARTCR